MVKTLAVINVKGGTGKTTMATHIAAALASSGLNTALADLDRQKSALAWMKRRPKTAASIKALDWTRKRGPIPKKTQRLIMDCPAQIRRRDVAKIVRDVDILLVPVLTSFFDEQATLRFLDRIRDISEIRKGRVPLLTVANRLRPTEREATALELLLRQHDYRLAARIPERSIYPNLAGDGLSIFDVRTSAALKEQNEWMSLLETLETLWFTGACLSKEEAGRGKKATP